MSSHRVDVISLFGGVVFLSFGVVGLLHATGSIDSGAPVWVAVAMAAGLGVLGIALSVRAALAGEPTVAGDATVVDDPVGHDTGEGVVSM